MVCCGGKEKSDDAQPDQKGDRQRVDSVEKGPPEPVVTKNKSKRGCTDIIFFLLFLGSWAAMWYIYAYSIQQGADYNK